MCAVLVPAVVHGHVSIWPRQAAAGATEKYTVRVPTEGKVMTIGADMEAPEGVTIETVAMPTGPNGIRPTAITRLTPMAE